jgi:hypothetical protein
MNLRYLGFEQRQNARAYQFDIVEKGQPPRQFVVTADLSIFLTYRVGLQEGPALSATKLAANLESNFDGAHELTGEDLRLYVSARLLAEAERAEKRSRGRRHPESPAAAQQRSPWRNSGI